MPDQHSDSPPAQIAPAEAALAPEAATATDPAIDPAAPAHENPRRRRHRRRTDWRQGGRTVRPWNVTVLAVALVGVGLGVVGGGLLARAPLPWAPFASTLVLWAGMLAAIVFAFVRSRPAGLLRPKPIDLLWGVGLGLALRLLQGWLSGADATDFPAAPTLDGALPPSWWLTEALPAGLIAPIVEEFFFRTVVLVVVFQLLRRPVGSVAAGLTALLVSAGGFVLLHGAAGALTLTDGIQLFAVGGTCALLVLLTGRIWGAVLTHVVYNVSYLALVVIGTTLA